MSLRGSNTRKEERELGETLSFMRAVWALDHALRSTSRRMRTRIGLTGPQRLVIRIVGRFPGVSAGRVAEVLHVDPSTLTGVFTRLERQGLIRRHADRLDGRRALFYLTEGGLRVDEMKAGTVEAAVRRTLARASDEQRQAARFVLETLVGELERDGAEERREKPLSRGPVATKS